MKDDMINEENMPVEEAASSSAENTSGKKPSKNKISRSGLMKLVIFVVCVAVFIAALFIVYRIEQKDTSSVFGKTASNDAFSFESGSNGVYALMGNDLIAASSTGVQIFNSDGTEVGQTVLSLSEPAISAGETSALLFDIGSTDCFVVTESGASRIIPTGSIITAVMAADGTYAVAADENGYKGLVTVYNSTDAEIYKWYAGSGYPVAMAISPDSKNLAVLTINDSGTTMHFFALNSTKEESFVTFGAEIVFDVTYLSNDKVCLVTDDCMYFTDAAGNIINVFDYGGKYLCDYDIDSTSFVTAVLSRSRSGSGGTVFTISTDGEQIASSDFSRDVISVSVAGKQVLVVTSGSVGIYSKNMGSSKKYDDIVTVKDALLRPDGTALLISNYSAEPARF